MHRYKSGSSSASELYVGGVNPTKYTGSFSYIPLSVQSFWQVTASAITLTSLPSASPIITFTPAIFDTGTSYIVAPADQADKFWAAVPGSKYVDGTGQYTYPCNQTVGLAVSFVGQDQVFTVSELDMNVRLCLRMHLHVEGGVDETGLVLWQLGLMTVGSQRCVGAVFGGDTAGNWIFGMSFLKNYYSTFDVRLPSPLLSLLFVADPDGALQVGGNQVGFATPAY